MSIARSRATTVSGVFDLLGSRAPARSTISRTEIGAPEVLQDFLNHG
jgi:hypothetical protein